jgi:hypothetical protein
MRLKSRMHGILHVRICGGPGRVTAIRANLTTAETREWWPERPRVVSAAILECHEDGGRGGGRIRARSEW